MTHSNILTTTTHYQRAVMNDDDVSVGDDDHSGSSLSTVLVRYLDCFSRWAAGSHSQSVIIGVVHQKRSICEVICSASISRAAATSFVLRQHRLLLTVAHNEPTEKSGTCLKW